ncbi:MAG: hypothetical protein QW687_00895 [Candidatus Hadarchaeales archaeon]
MFELSLIASNLKALWSILRDERGEITEKAILLAIIILMTIGAITYLASRIVNTFNRVSNVLQ